MGTSMIKVGKYWGSDDAAPVYQIQETLDPFYEDMSCVEAYIIMQVEMDLSEQDAMTYAQQYIDTVGRENLSERDQAFMLERGIFQQ